MNCKKHWSKNEAAFVQEHYLKLGYSEIGKILNRSEPAISQKVQRLNLIKEKQWTNEELEFLKNNYQNYNYAELALKFNCQKKVIQRKAHLLGMVKNRHWTQTEIQFVKDNYALKGSNYCANKLGINNRLIWAKASNLGINKLKGEIRPGYFICSTCKLTKSKNLFYFNKKHTRSRCKACDIKAILIKRKTDIRTNILHKLRSRLRKTICEQFATKSQHTIKLLGCSLQEFKSYFQEKFTPDMSWEAFMQGKIHIDHVKPCFLFDLLKPEEQEKCFHYTNLQPLWAKDNLSKGSKF